MLSPHHLFLLLQNVRPLAQDKKCAYAWGEGIDTSTCDNVFACGVCMLPRGKVYKLKGLCAEDIEDEDYDLDYYVYGNKNGKPHFRC